MNFHISPLPRHVPTPSAPRAPLLEQTLTPPLTPLRIHIPRRLHRDARPRAPRGNLLPSAAFQLRHIDPLASVELERGLRARDFEVQLGGRVGHFDEGAQDQVARVEGDDVGGVEDEAVVKGRGGGAEGEGGVWGRGDGGVWGYEAGGDGGGVDGEVLVGCEGDDVVGYGGGGGVEVEVADVRWMS